MAMLLTSVAFATREWIFLGMLSAGILFLARLDVRSHGLIWVPPTALGLLLLKWLPALEQGDASRFLWTAGGFAALFVLGGYAGLFGARKPLAWAVVSGAFGPFALLVGHAGWKTLERAFPWGLTALVGATLYAILAWPLHRRRERLGDAPLAAMLVAASTLLSLAIPLELRREWLAVGWAIEVLGLVALAGRLKVAALRTMALVLVATVTARLLLNPHVLEYPIGRLPVFNWLLYGYGVPLAAFVGAAVLAERQGDAMLRRTLAWAALGFAFALLTLEVRHVFHRDHLGRGIAGFREWGVYIIGWLGLGLSLWRLAGRWPSLVHARAGTTVLSGALVFTAVGPGLLANPLLEHHWVGALPILNHIAWVLGVPVALFLWIWRAAARRGSNALARGSACAALLVSFLLVTLQVRQLFQGGFLDRGAASPAERYTYSAAWILFGTILLVLGIALRRKSMRLAALGVMLIAVLKVFLYDLAALRDLYRVFSFLGLGVSLLLLAWLYQRYVFRERPPSGETV